MQFEHFHSHPQPEPWREYRARIRRRWQTPFYFFNWCCEHLANLMSRWKFLEVLEYLGSFSILLAVIFWFAEAPQRVMERHYQAWQVINTAQGKGGNGGRIDALEELNQDGVSLIGVDLMDAFLQNIDLKHAQLNRAIFSSADLRGANFSYAQLESSHFIYANLRGAHLVHADLTDTMLDDADLTGASLKGANLAGVSLDGTELSNADLSGADLSGLISWKTIDTIGGANLSGVRNAPDGFIKWALQHGAVGGTESPTTNN
ncbi:MAG TPA: pentapeptide repeat-containing protein [Phycisphaerae bacterium]|nr:pentapeptide repeat-containing protein [Phycisphaerae bacterium]